MIYVIEEGLNGPLKIGTTVNLEERLKTLQGGNSKQLQIIMSFECGSKLESKIHNDLTEFKIREKGEWFYRDDKVFKYLNHISPIEPKTEFQDGEEYIVLWRENEESPTDFCPFCGKRHIHGKGDGHRVSHCAFGEDTFTRKSDGKIFKQSQGYIVRTKNK